MRAQISVDFIIASIVVMSLFFLIFGLYVEKSRGAGTLLASLESQRLAEKLAWAINDVSLGGEGASAEVVLPDSIFGEEYYVFIEDRWVEVVWQHSGLENRMAFPLMSNRTRGDIYEPNTVLKVVNRGGVVEVS